MARALLSVRAMRSYVVIAAVLVGSVAGAAEPSRYAFNVGMGGSVFIDRSDLHGLPHVAVEMELGYALSESGRAWLIFPTQVLIDPENGIVNLPVGLEYDIGVTDHLSVSARGALGISVFTCCRLDDETPAAFGFAMAGLGLKWQVRGRWTIGIEPAEVQVMFAEHDFVAQYRGTVYSGVTF